MNKEEILKKSRNQNSDEGLANAENIGRKLAFSVFSVVFAIIMFFNIYIKETNYAILALFWTYVAAEIIPKYRFRKKTLDLVGMIGSFFLAAAFFVMYILTKLDIKL